MWSQTRKFYSIFYGCTNPNNTSRISPTNFSRKITTVFFKLWPELRVKIKIKSQSYKSVIRIFLKKSQTRKQSWRRCVRGNISTNWPSTTFVSKSRWSTQEEKTANGEIARKTRSCWRHCYSNPCVTYRAACVYHKTRRSGIRTKDR